MLHRDLTDVAAREQGRARAAELERDLGARVAGAHDERTAVRQLLGAAVVARVELDDPRIELPGRRGRAGSSIGTGRDDDAVRLEPAAGGREDEPVALMRQPLDAYAVYRPFMKLKTSSAKNLCSPPM